MSFTSGSSGSEGPAWDLTKMHGRESESKLLQGLAKEGQKSHATVVLHGIAGSGKSTLIRSQPWKSNGWIFAEGKFEQHRTGEPFSALIEALDKLIDSWVHYNSLAEVCQMGGFRHLLEEDFEFLRNILPKAYAKVAQSSGACSKGTGFSEHHKKKRNSSFTMKQDLGIIECLHASFVRVLKFLCTRQPVVLFIDDIHWADQATLAVLKVLASGEKDFVDNLVVAVSYRDEEMKDSKELVEYLDFIKTTEDADTRIHDIAVQDLNVESVNQMVSSITLHPQEDTLPLAEVIHRKTAGNPFFVTQFLLMLRHENFLTYSFSTFKWDWGDIDKLSNAAHVSDNVADIIAKSFESLSEATRVAINVASCLGKIVPLDVLIASFESFVEEQAGHTCCAGLHQIQMQGLMSVLDGAVQQGILIKPQGQDAYMWAHDKLQTVAYSLIPDEFRPSLHVKLGKLLWRLSLNQPDEEWMVFMAADQLNRFSDYQKDQVLGAEVAALCLEAAKLSLSKSALFPAFDMLMAGVKHIEVEDRWTAHYDLSLRLYSTIAELAVQLGKKDEAMKAVTEVQSFAKNYEDKFRVECVMLKCITSGTDRDYDAGVRKTLEILKDYGIKFPSKLVPGQMFLENQKLKRQLPGGKLDGFLTLPEMTDQHSLRAMKLLVEYLGSYIFMSPRGDKNLAFFAGIRALNLSIAKGVCEETALAVISMASAQVRDGNFEDGNEYADIALKVIERFPQTVGSKHASIMGMRAAAIFSVTKPLNKVLDMWLEAHHVALRTGNTEKAAGSILGYTYTYITVGLPLGPLLSDVDAYEKESRQFNMPETVAAVYLILKQFILNLRSNVKNPAVLKGEAMDEDEMLGRLSGNGRRMTKRDIYSFRLFLAVIYGYMDMAEILFNELEEFGGAEVFAVRSGLRRSVMALAGYRLERLKGKKKYRTYAKSVTKDYEKDIKKGNVNAYPLFLMLKAEEKPSKEAYDTAIRACARLGLVHYEAYLCERAAEFFLSEKDEGWAEFYMAQAFVLYEDWGALGKAERIKEEHPELLKSSTFREKANSALKGRTRYSSEHADLLKDFDWERLSSASTMSSGKRSSASDTNTDATSDTSSERNSVVAGAGIFLSSAAN